MDNEFRKDQAEILGEALRSGRIDRRRFLAGSAMLGLSVGALGSSKAFAQSNEVVLANWGGDAVPASQKAYGGPLEKAGRKLTINTTGPTPGRI